VRARRELGIGDDEIVASYVGTVGMAHGIGTILEAAQRLLAAAPRVRFLVVGDGAERESLEKAAAERGLANLRFLGMLPRERMPSVLAASDVSLVLLRGTPLFETVLPSKMFEAMAAARPIVLGVRGEAARTLELSGGGVAITPEDPGQLAEVLEGLAGDEARRRALGAAGREFVGREFSRAFWARRMLEVMERVATGADARRGPRSRA
jgi:glycosyltransferase involved in cell wall biosynthesis